MTRIGSKELKQIKRGIERVVAFSFFLLLLFAYANCKNGASPKPQFLFEKNQKGR